MFKADSQTINEIDKKFKSINKNTILGESFY